MSVDNTRKMKDSGVAWVGAIPQDWTLLSTKRFFQAKKRIAGAVAEDYERLALTMHGVIKRSKDDSEGLQPEKFEGYQILEKNELVFKLIDLENVKTSRVGLSPYIGLVSPAYIVLTNNEKDNRFYYYWFLFLYYNEVFNHLGGNGVRSALNAKDVCELPVPNINGTEQKRIADYLDDKVAKIDAAVDKLNRYTDLLVEYKNAFLEEHVKCDEGVIRNVGSLGIFKNGLNYADTGRGKKVRFLGVGDFKDYFIIDDTNKLSFITIEGEIASDFYLEDGDIVFVRSNGSKELVGRAVMVDNINSPVTYSGFCIRYRCISKELVDNRWLLYFFRTPYFRKMLEKYSYGSNINNMNQGLLSGIRVTLPPIETQHRNALAIKDKCELIDRETEKNKVLLKKLNEYKKSLIYEVVTGKREVP